MTVVAMHTRRQANRTATRHMIIPMITPAMITQVITITTMTIIMTAIIAMTRIAVMTTSKPARPGRRAVARAGSVNEAAARPQDSRSAMQANEAAALYRLMTWL